MPGGIPSKNSIKKTHRGVDESYYGNIGALATTEYADVGITNHLTMTPLISNKYGSFGKKDPKSITGWDIVTLDEGLVPFINELDAGRGFLAL